MLLVALTVLLATAAGVLLERRFSGAGAAARGILQLMLYVLVPFVSFVNIAHLHLTVSGATGLVLAHLATAAAGAQALAGTGAVGRPHGKAGQKQDGSSDELVVGDGRRQMGGTQQGHGHRQPQIAGVHEDDRTDQGSGSGPVEREGTPGGPCRHARNRQRRRYAQAHTG